MNEQVNEYLLYNLCVKCSLATARLNVLDAGVNRHSSVICSLHIMCRRFANNSFVCTNFIDLNRLVWHWLAFAFGNSANNALELNRISIYFTCKLETEHVCLCLCVWANSEVSMDKWCIIIDGNSSKTNNVILNTNTKEKKHFWNEMPRLNEPNRKKWIDLYVVKWKRFWQFHWKSSGAK